MRDYYLKRIEIVEKAAKETDEVLGSYILKAVTEDLSFTYLKTVLDIPCGKDMYYNRYRKFFWILSTLREQYKSRYIQVILWNKTKEDLLWIKTI